jgi:hypothetical protein
MYLLGPFISMTERGNDGQHFFCPAHVIEFFLKVLREKTLDSKFTRIPRFSGFPTPLAVMQIRLVAATENVLL